MRNMLRALLVSAMMLSVGAAEHVKKGVALCSPSSHEQPFAFATLNRMLKLNGGCAVGDNSLNATLHGSTPG